MPFQRLRLLIAYDGRPFRGWQSQASRDAVQDHLERAFLKLCGMPIVVHGSGRTDAGVHAHGQVAHADVPPKRLPPSAWAAALNAHLPAEIRVLRVRHVSADFHARLNARRKIYTYRIWNAPCLHPLELGRAWLVPGELDVQIMRAAASMLTGTHDFAAFAANRRQPPGETVRTIYQIRIVRRGPLITLRYDGSGFLYKMVRLLTGSLVRCGQGRASPEWLGALLARADARKTSFAAPADGLYLVRVLY